MAATSYSQRTLNSLVELVALLIAACPAGASAQPTGTARSADDAVKVNSERVERWGTFELSVNGPADGNPFLDVQLRADFKQGDRLFEAGGFYDGDGVYRIRFMPDAVGPWTYVTHSNRSELDGRRGTFTCVEPSPGNHGPVRVAHTWHFAYADGTPYFQVGTTCYAWTHQGDALEAQTLASLKQSPFNKMRMCVFPKSYAYNKNEPPRYPFEGRPPKDWDFTRFNPDYFRHFEKRVADLRDLGIEADIILLHPYDRWGFKRMGAEADDRYLRYVVARLAAYRNVWWSMANEFDFMKGKKESDWDRFFQIVRKHDPYNHMRGIHNGVRFYDHTKPWVTHASIQNHDLPKVLQWRSDYRKPIIVDECGYEGNIPKSWGNLSAQELVRRFWIGTMRGGYVGHGETYEHPEDLLWWSKGGVLRGQSPARIAFLKKIISRVAFHEFTPQPEPTRGNYLLSKEGRAYYLYFRKLARTTIRLAGPGPYEVEGIDTWEMTVDSLGTAPAGEFTFKPPKADYLIRLTAGPSGEPLRHDASRPDERGTTGPASKSSRKPIPVILDTDIGDDIDDTWALAFLLKCPELDLKLAVGDQGEPLYRAKLLAKMLETAGRTDVPVGIGLDIKKKKEERQGAWVEDYDLKSYPGKVYQDGVQAIIDTIIQSKEPVTVIATGPLPNLAAALEREPKIAERARFVGMHGSVRRGYGGPGVSAEYNVRGHTKAAQRVFTAPWDMTITPLDTCGLVTLKDDKYAKVRDSKDPVAAAVIENYRIYSNNPGKNPDLPKFVSSILFDTVAVYLAFRTDLVKMEDLGIRVTDGGRTEIDPDAKVIHVATEWIGMPAFEDFLVERLTTANPAVTQQDQTQQMTSHLTLTDGERQKLTTLLQEEAQKRRDVMGEADLASQKRRERIKQLRDELRRLGEGDPTFMEAQKTLKARQDALHKRLKAILTPDQWKQWRRLQDPGQDVIVNSMGMKLKRIPAGSFIMGCDHPLNVNAHDEKPAHRVTFTKPFYVGVYEVTQREYQEIMGRNPSTYQGDTYPRWAGRKITTKVPYRDEYRPVDSVNWYDAQEFCARLSAREGVQYRLPTEAEWEYACRAGTTTNYYWGDKWEAAYCDFDEETKARNKDVIKALGKIPQTAEVGTRKPNAWGLYDMMGNQKEWCEDAYAPYRAGDQVDPEPVTKGFSRIARGGYWGTDAGWTSSTRGVTQSPLNGNGFRVVRTIPQD